MPGSGVSVCLNRRRSAKLGHEPAVDVQDLTRDEGRGWGYQERDGLGNIVTRPSTPQGQVLAPIAGRIGGDLGGTDRIHPDTHRTKIRGKGTGQCIQATFRSVVDRVPVVGSL